MQQRGITLVEMLTTIAVLGILLGIGMPGYGFLANSVRLTGLTNDLVSSLNLARSEAIKRGVWVTVCKSGNPLDTAPACSPDGNWQQGWLVFVDRGLAGEREETDPLLQVKDGSEKASITATNFSDFVSYLPSGSSRGPNNLPNGTLTLCLEGKQRKLVINNTGRIKLVTGQC